MTRGESYCVPALEHLEERRLLAVNLAPVNSVPTTEQLVTADTPFAFTNYRLNAISISDPDAGNNVIEVSLDVPDVSSLAAGVLTLVDKDRVPANELEFLLGDGLDDKHIIVRASQDNLNTILAWVVYKPANGYLGTASIVVRTDDLGNTGTGGSQLDTDSIPIKVTALNNGFNSAPAWTTTPSALDTTFDTDGLLVLGETGAIDYIDQMELLSDGSIAAGGIAGDEVAIYRFDADISLDSTFGNSGILKTGHADVIRPGTLFEVEEESPGCYLVGGGSRLFKYFPDGTLDGSFGQGGTGFVEFVSDQGFWDLDFEADGQILVVNDGGIFRLSPDGVNVNLLVSGSFRGVKARDIGDFLAVDADFGVRHYNRDASQVNFFGGPSGATSSILELPDENILLIGATGLGDVLLSRHLSSGQLDTSFGNSGAVSVTITGRSDRGYQASLQADGKILVSGRANSINDDDFFVARLSFNGVEDVDFNGGTQSFVIVPIAAGTNDTGFDVVALPDGRILVAGGADDDVGMVRLKGDWNPPVMDTVGNVTVDEDAGAQTIDLTGIGAGTGDTQNVSVTVSSDNSALFSLLEVDYAVGQTTATLNFQTTAEASGLATVTIQVMDGGLDSNLATLEDNSFFDITLDVNVLPINDAPLLDSAGGANFTTINEDATSNNGDLVSALVASSISDADAAAVQGIAVNGLAIGNGTSQFSTNNGTSWSDVGVVTDNSALLLIPTDRLRFVPDGLNADSGSVTYRAWDQTAGAAGTKVNVSVNGGATAFSTAADTASITVTGVNDGPQNSVPGAQSINEDSNLTFNTSGGNAISVSDVDVGANDLQVTLSTTDAVLTLASTTGLAFSVGDGTDDASMTFTGTVTNINASLNGLT